MTDHRIYVGAEYRTDDRDSRTYHEGVMAAIHGWSVCPHNGYEYRRDWWAGYNAQRALGKRHPARKPRSARHRKPGKNYRRAA